MKKDSSKISFQVRWKLALGQAECFIPGAQTGEGPPVKEGGGREGAAPVSSSTRHGWDVGVWRRRGWNCRETGGQEGEGSF